MAQMYVVGVSKTRVHGARWGRRYHGTKKYWTVYYYDENGKFHTKVIDATRVLYYSMLKRKWSRYFCYDCQTTFKTLYDEPFCPLCGSRTLKPVERKGL